MKIFEFFDGKFNLSINGVSFLIFSVLAIAAVGYLLGKITIKGVNLGTAGVFLIALVFGCLFYDKLGDQIFDNGFRIDFDALKWAFNNEFDDVFGDMHLPNWLSSILYALCVLAGAIATLLWIGLFILILLGIIALIIKLF